MLTVRDLMQQDVVTVPPEMSVRQMARMLADQGISGVPVVSRTGDVLGVVSATDVVRLAAEEQEVRLSSARWVPVPASGAADPEDDPEDPFGSFFLPEEQPVLSPEWGQQGSGGPLDRLSVADIMTPVSFSVTADTPVRRLADYLVRGRIHRAIVLDDGRLQGIVTTMDVLRALADQRL